MVAQWNIGGVHPTSMADSGDFPVFSPVFSIEKFDKMWNLLLTFMIYN